MTREWKPGDLAIATVRGACGVLVLRIDLSTAMGQRHYGWASYAAIEGTNLHPESQVTEARPLVVIDPEDREAVERLAFTIRDNESHDWIESTVAALREFANPTPPKPEEPTGLGAVVEDADGDLWVWMAQGAEGAHWHRVGFPEKRANWHDIAAVRVLSEGVAR